MDHPQETETYSIELVEMYRGVPVLRVSCREPVLLTAESDLQLALRLLEQPYPRFAVVVDYKNLTHSSNYTPDEKAANSRKEPFQKLAERVVALVRYQAVSITSLVHSMRADMLLRHSRNFTFAPDIEAAVRAVRRTIDRLQVSVT